jgi:hypothetical protein
MLSSANAKAAVSAVDVNSLDKKSPGGRILCEQI